MPPLWLCSLVGFVKSVVRWACEVRRVHGVRKVCGVCVVRGVRGARGVLARGNLRVVFVALEWLFLVEVLIKAVATATAI